METIEIHFSIFDAVNFIYTRIENERENEKKKDGKVFFFVVLIVGSFAKAQRDLLIFILHSASKRKTTMIMITIRLYDYIDRWWGCSVDEELNGLLPQIFPSTRQDNFSVISTCHASNMANSCFINFCCFTHSPRRIAHIANVNTRDGCCYLDRCHLVSSYEGKRKNRVRRAHQVYFSRANWAWRNRTWWGRWNGVERVQ